MTLRRCSPTAPPLTKLWKLTTFFGSRRAAVLLLVKVVDVTNPTTAYVLALANSFGGSLIIIGSVSNIIVVQQARELGIKISFRDFARLGVPVTLAALAGLLAWVNLLT